MWKLKASLIKYIRIIQFPEIFDRSVRQITSPLPHMLLNVIVKLLRGKRWRTCCLIHQLPSYMLDSHPCGMGCPLIRQLVK